MFEKVSANLDFLAREQEVIKFWNDREIFQKSVELRKGAEPFTFYDGPPTANGKPHIGHIETRAFKDVIPRYQTMKGKNVLRKAGWDTHGLPVELEIEKKLGFSGKKAIEDYGVAEFNRRCRQSVFDYVEEWEKLTERMATGWTCPRPTARSRTIMSSRCGGFSSSTGIAASSTRATRSCPTARAAGRR